MPDENMRRTVRRSTGWRSLGQRKLHSHLFFFPFSSSLLFFHLIPSCFSPPKSESERFHRQFTPSTSPFLALSPWRPFFEPELVHDRPGREGLWKLFPMKPVSDDTSSLAPCLVLAAWRTWKSAHLSTAAGLIASAGCGCAWHAATKSPTSPPSKPSTRMRRVCTRWRHTPPPPPPQSPL